MSFWYNPNIHPYQEYKARRDTLKDYAASIGADAILVNYSVENFQKDDNIIFMGQ